MVYLAKVSVNFRYFSQRFPDVGIRQTYERLNTFTYSYMYTSSHMCIAFG
jgi:hypothetical protein